MDQAEPAQRLRGEVPFLAAKGGAAGEGDPLRAVDRVAGRILRDEGGVASVFDALGQFVEHVVPGDLLPLVGAGCAIHGVFDPARAGRELHRRRAFGAEPSLVDRAVGIALDLEQLGRSVGVRFCVGDQRAADRAIRTHGMRLRGVRDVEALLGRNGLGHVEPEGGEAGRTRPGGADLQKVAARDLWHPIPPRNRVCRRLNVSVLTGPGGCQQIRPGVTVGLDMNAWFEALGRRFAEAARDRGATVAPPELDPQVADELLELARVSAHSKERRFAPLACYMAGAAVERLRQAGISSAADEATYIRTIREEVEAEPPATERSLGPS